jgi:hypothetical protein
MTWDNETIQTLRTLWDQGHSTAEIGRRMGFSKNSIVGKAHRLNLSERESPIIRTGIDHPRRIVPAGRTTLPALASTTAPPFVVAVRLGPEPKELAEDVAARIKALHANGIGYKAICEKTGISNYFVRRALGYRKPEPVVRVVEPVAPLIMAVKPVFVAPVVTEVAPVRIPAAGQCAWLSGSRPYVQCTEMALAGEGMPRPWSYCGCHRAVAYAGRHFIRDEAA